MIRRIRRAFKKSTPRHLLEKGASAVEYGLMVAAIAAVIVGIVFGLGTLVTNAFQKTCVAIASGNDLNNKDCGTPVGVTPAPNNT